MLLRESAATFLHIIALSHSDPLSLSLFPISPMPLPRSVLGESRGPKRATGNQSVVGRNDGEGFAVLFDIERAV